jgi:hypothetical protein
MPEAYGGQTLTPERRGQQTTLALDAMLMRAWKVE